MSQKTETELIDQLKSRLPALGPKTAVFATSLINQFDKNGTLSPKQIGWVEKLATAVPGSPNGVIDTIAEHIMELKAKQRPFAISLVEQWSENGFLSEKQDWWANKMAGDILESMNVKQGGPVAPDQWAPSDTEPTLDSPIPTVEPIVEIRSENRVIVELRPQVFAVIDTTTNTILGTFDDEASARHSVQAWKLNGP